MLSGIDHNPGMSAPDRQIAGLRIYHSAEFVNPHVEVGRGSVVIGEASALIEGVDQVRAVWRVMPRIECDAHNRQALMASRSPRPSLLVLGLLCQPCRGDQQAEHRE